MFTPMFFAFIEGNSQVFFPPLAGNDPNTVFRIAEGNNGDIIFTDLFEGAINKSGSPIYSNNQNLWNKSAIYFDRNSWLFTPLTSAITFGNTGELTWECWVYFTEYNYSNAPIAIMGNARSDFGGNYGLSLSLITNGSIKNFQFRHWVNGNTPANHNLAIQLNTWYHVAVTKNSANALEVFVNGIKGSSGLTSSHTNDDFYIGTVYNNSGFTANLQGFLYDIRLHNNLKYTANFDPLIVSEILTNDDPYYANVVLLLEFEGINSSTNFIDETGKTITVNGNAQISTTQKKFGDSSGYFDGNGDYLSINNDTSLNLASTDKFTIEAWVYKAGGITQAILGNVAGVASRGFNFLINSNEKLRFQSDGGNPDLISNLTVPSNQWVHVSISKNGNNYIFSVNGTVEVLTNSTNWNTSTSSIFSVGYSSRSDFPYWFNGYIDRLKITKGIARYPFIPPVNILPSDPVNSFLMLFEGVNGSSSLIEETGKTITNNAVVISTSQFKSGNSSGYFNGNSAIIFPKSQLDLSSSVNPTWTIECWIYLLNTTGEKVLFTTYNFIAGAQSGTMFFSNQRIGVDPQYFNYSLPNNQWVHWAVTRNSSNEIALYLNGVFINKIAINNIVSSNNNYIGGSPGDNNIGGMGINAYIDNFRIALGEVLYTQNFIPEIDPSNPVEPDPDPLEIFGSDLIVWCRADDVVLNGSTASIWNDKSGNNNHAFQNTAISQPPVLATGFNGKPCLDFTSNKWFQLPNCLDPIWGEASLFILYNFANRFSDMSATSLGVDNNGSYWWANGITQFNQSFFGEFRANRINGQPGVNNSLGDGGQALVEVVSGISSYKIHKNTIQLLSTTPDWGVSTTPYIGKGGTSSITRNFQGQIAEFILVKKEVTELQKTQLRNYLKNYYTLTIY
jgi:hypothetical protein